MNSAINNPPLIKQPVTKNLENPQEAQAIRQVFEHYPELTSIGSPEDYNEYIQTIFPESKVRHVVWHGSKDSTHSFTQNNEGIFFTDSIHYANMYGNELAALSEGIVTNKSLPVVIDIKNPYHPSVSISTRPSHKDMFFNPKDTPPGHDGVIGKDAYAESLGESVIAFNPEQIHILGSSEDIEKFKDFVQSKKQA